MKLYFLLAKVSCLAIGSHHAKAVCDYGQYLERDSCVNCPSGTYNPFMGHTGFEDELLLPTSPMEKGRPTNVTLSRKSSTSRVMANLSIVAIYWGGREGTAFADEIDLWYQKIGTSPWYATLFEFNTPDQNITEGSFWGYVDDNEAPLGEISRKQINDRLQFLINTGRVPYPTDDILYSFHFNPKANATGDGKSCGYHSYGVLKDGEKRYMYPIYYVIPDMQTLREMGTKCGQNDMVSTLSTLAHEVSEVVTDPYLDAWMDKDVAHEIADVCTENTYTIAHDGTRLIVQAIYSNKANACVSAPFSQCYSCPPGTVSLEGSSSCL